MPIAITIPRLGWNMEEGVFVGWLKKAGERVDAHDSLFSLESDKSTQEIESPATGTLKIIATVGEVYKVGDVLGEIL